MNNNPMCNVLFCGITKGANPIRPNASAGNCRLGKDSRNIGKNGKKYLKKWGRIGKISIKKIWGII